MNDTIRSGRIVSAIRPNPELVSTALRRAYETLDQVDNGGSPYIGSSLYPDSQAREDAHSWMWACLLILDECDIDSVTVAAIAARIWKGRQDEFNIRG